MSEKEDRRAMWESLSPRERLAVQRERHIAEMEHPDFNAAIVDRAQERMARVDAFPPEVRAVIYEHGLELVQEFWNHGVRKAKSIGYLIDTAQCNDLANGQRRFKLNSNARAKNLTEWCAGDKIGAHLIVVYREPSKKMIEASLAEVSGHTERVTKTEKHRRRLLAALAAAERT